MTSYLRRGGAVLGSPIAHSLSPVLHRAAYVALGFTDWTYRAVECTEETLEATLRELEAEGLAGASLTMPLKRAVLPMLARSDRLVADVGAANTVLFGGVPGDWYGANTDVPGFVAALRRSSQLAAAGSAAVLGGGATAASAVAALRDLGLGAVDVFVRRPERCGDLLAAAGRLGVVVELRQWQDASAALPAYDLVVATTPAGATDELAARLQAATQASRLGVFFDVVYAPWPTALAEAWAGARGAVIGGLELLVEQAAVQVTLMTGQPAPVDAMRAAGLAALD
jgi:shikimate dehydrogenase